ncbi:hypothetical protein HPB52_012525 [Rhipicephalus sanguineus]|uniref:Uncharacterized protein n=1 Tax=Rhipicephalus sanguineus TaxID=34632 RepID=A0A9D4PN19_RHISA|nr:hypothetical protein HPB52_012525 [Rhipicephalus sanguineus]
MNSSGRASKEPQLASTPFSRVEMLAAVLNEYESLWRHFPYDASHLQPEGRTAALWAPPPSPNRVHFIQQRRRAVIERRRLRFGQMLPYVDKRRCSCLLSCGGNVSTVPGRVPPRPPRSRIHGCVDASSPAAPENECAMDLTLCGSRRAATPRTGQYVAEPARRVTAEKTSASIGHDLSTTPHDQPSATTTITTDCAAMAAAPEKESRDDDPDDRSAGKDVFSMHEFYEDLDEIDSILFSVD